MMMMFSLSTPAYPMGMLCGYKTNHLSPLPAEASRVSIIVQINAGGSNLRLICEYLAQNTEP